MLLQCMFVYLSALELHLNIQDDRQIYSKPQRQNKVDLNCKKLKRVYNVFHAPQFSTRKD